jgi:hypothetical protein
MNSNACVSIGLIVLFITRSLRISISEERLVARRVRMSVCRVFQQKISDLVELSVRILSEFDQATLTSCSYASDINR